MAGEFQNSESLGSFVFQKDKDYSPLTWAHFGALGDFLKHLAGIEKDALITADVSLKRRTAEFEGKYGKNPYFPKFYRVQYPGQDVMVQGAQVHDPILVTTVRKDHRKDFALLIGADGKIYAAGNLEFDDLSCVLQDFPLPVPGVIREMGYEAYSVGIPDEILARVRTLAVKRGIAQIGRAGSLRNYHTDHFDQNKVEELRKKSGVELGGLEKELGDFTLLTPPTGVIPENN